MTPVEVLNRYWGYSAFRPMQAEIIGSVLAGHDTLGLLPTGGGKSITFQVPAMMLPGLTLVVTPLISLMKDQVDNLRDRGITAAFLHAGMSRREHRLALDRCEAGHAKILYVSPEKLQSETFISRLRYMHISLIVVDEAHCISQWGYDFRPSYLRLGDLRRILGHRIPVLALTASATPEVTDDIMKRLEFDAPRVFALSFSRSNLSYIVRYEEYKEGKVLSILRNTTGTAIVYVRSRRRARELSEFLASSGISVDYYHAGLSAEEKNERQNRWKSGECRVMVATNAFGMGIDKPDVRYVIHHDLPSSLEEYYQEAGRAGRDGLPSFAILIVSRSDKATLTRRLNDAFPDRDYIRHVYEMTGNFLNVAVGDGYNHLYDFNFNIFCERFGLRAPVTRSALMLLTRAGYIEFIDEVATASRVMITAGKHELYGLQVTPETDEVLQMLLRNYTGLFADYVPVDERLIASRLLMKEEDVYQSLLALQREHVLHYIPRKVTPYIFYSTSRELPKHIVLDKSVYEDQRDRMKRRIDAMKDFAYRQDQCRVAGMLAYFGEKNPVSCGTCDICRESHPRKSLPKATAAETVRRVIESCGGDAGLDHISEKLPDMRRDEIVEGLRTLISSGCVIRVGASGFRLTDTVQ